MYIYNWFILFASRKQYNIVNQLHRNQNIFLKLLFII